MTDLIERLRVAVITEVNPIDELTYPTNLGEEAAGEIERLRAAWRPINTAPKDGTRFWGRVDDDAIAMLWHETFQEFVSTWRRMTMAPGYLIDGAAFQDHSPKIHHPEFWMPIPE